MDNSKRLDVLRKFFAISTAAFEFQVVLSKTLGGLGKRTFMHELHVQAKIELDKENPNMELVDKLIATMEEEAAKNSTAKPPFDKGGEIITPS